MNHLFMIQEQAANRMEILINQMKQSEGVTEELKSNDQILWVQMMNNIQNRAEEIVLTEIIYDLGTSPQFPTRVTPLTLH